ncbi:MAG: alpha/beta hydrolase family protein [Phycisphaeraceae bacterium]
MSQALTPESYTRTLKSQTLRQFAFHATDRHELAVWQASFRPAMKRALGLDVIAERGRCALDARREGEESFDDHVRELWTIQSEPGFRLPFYLLRPREQDGPRPVVLTPHGHGKGAKATYVGIAADDEERAKIAEGERDIALQAVRAGYVAIAPDMRGFASLRMQADIERDATCSCDALQKRALLFGRTLVGERVWDMGRLIDYAMTRDEIDTSRVMITGNSGGGTVSLFAAACDERIGVCVPGSYFCTFADSIAAVPHCACNFVPGIMRMAEMPEVAGLIAPRPFLAVNGVEDPIFPIDATRQAYANLHAIYEVAGAGKRCQLYEGDGGHRYYKAPVWPFAAEHL